MSRVALYLGPFLAAAFGVALHRFGSPAPVAWTVGVTTLAAIWWTFEPVPIPVTSLVPLAVLPLAGVLTPDEVGAAYGNPLVLLMLGGFILSTAMERSGAHRRIAVGMVTLVGGASGRRLVFGFMAASALLSMWISNSATTLMLLPIVIAVFDHATDPRLRRSLLLGVAYAASIGGIGTPIGSPPNLIFLQVYSQQTGTELTFLDWMGVAVPIMLVMGPLAALWLTRGLSTGPSIQLPTVGPWRTDEVRTLAVFAVTALLWITRQEPWGGWRELIGLPAAGDASVALLAVVAMFLIPNGTGGRLLDWTTAAKIPWGVLILFGSGVAIAKAFERSGLSATLGESLRGLGSIPVLAMVLTVCVAVTFLTEITSNTATAVLLMPILAAAATAAKVDPKLLMIPAAISASFAFMLPVATPPNAIVFAREEVTVRDMAQAGLALNLIGAVVIAAICYLRFR